MCRLELFILLGIGAVFLFWLQSKVRKPLPRSETQPAYRSPPRPASAASLSAGQGRAKIVVDLPPTVLAVEAPAMTGSNDSTAKAKTQEVVDRLTMNAFGIVYRNERYVHGSYGFATLRQAVDYAKQLKADLPKNVAERGVANPVIEAPAAVARQEARPALQPTSAHVPVRPVSAPPRPRSAPKAGEPPRWLSSGELLDLGGLKISGGLFYAGKANNEAWRSENCLVDTSLPVAANAPADGGASDLSYWPSYRGLSASVRRAYLEWLAGGRRDPDAPIGLVFLYFYGLERRLLHEKAFQDAEEIIDEVRSLRVVYDQNGSFSSYATRLLDVAEVVRTSEIVRPPLLAPAFSTFEMPLATRRYFGAVLAEGRAFDADDALLWILSLPLWFRTPVARCFDELCALWRLRFGERHPGGLKVRAPKTRLESVYRAASGRFETSFALGAFPDICAVSAPLNHLKEMFDACVQDLDAFSRLLGRRPEGRGGLEAALCLPRDLRATPMARGAEIAREALFALIGDRKMAVASVKQVADILETPLAEPKLSLPIQRRIGGMLDQLDIAFEPDRRYGETGLAPDGEMVIFAAEGGAAPHLESQHYGAARTMAEIAALAATVDGEVVAAEFDQISADLQVMPGLSPADRVRLLAVAFYVLRAPPKQQAALGRLAKLPEGARRGVSAAAIGAVLADGRVEPTEVRFLERLHKTLNLPQEEVYAALHRGAVQVDAPVSIAPEEPSAGVAIPPEAPRDPDTVAFDATRLERIRRETNEVAGLLSSIFTDEDDAPTPAKAEAKPSSSAFAGLEPNHAQLLVAILSADGLEREIFDARARELKLLPDGALETINEWGFETFDEAVIDDEDLLMPVAHLAAELRTMGNLA